MLRIDNGLLIVQLDSAIQFNSNIHSGKKNRNIEKLIKKIVFEN